MTEEEENAPRYLQADNAKGPAKASPSNHSLTAR